MAGFRVSGEDLSFGASLCYRYEYDIFERDIFMLSFVIEKTACPISVAEREKLMENPAFGRVFTDHMAVIRYTEGKSWHNAKIVPRQALPIDPASTVLHYGQEIFEGLKAYHGPKGEVTLFRPEANAARFAASARRLAMAELPEELFIQSIEELLKVDRDWIPSGDGQSLYLRPFMISDEAFLGVKPARDYLFTVLASPVGSYFGGHEAVPVWVTETYSRAAPGGTGEAKCGGNYAASLLAQQEAHKQGCAQVLFLDACQRRYIEEMGGMNVMFVFKNGSIITPPLGGTILRGVTRDSLLQLGRKMGLEMREELLDLNEVLAGIRSGEIVEAFACGTAAVISAIGCFRGTFGEVCLGDGKTEGPVAQRLRQALYAIQRCQAEDPFGWVRHVSLS